jgi:hypothetical protein
LPESVFPAPVSPLRQAVVHGIGLPAKPTCGKG